jgi:hypothetical protein
MLNTEKELRKIVKQLQEIRAKLELVRYYPEKPPRIYSKEEIAAMGIWVKNNIFPDDTENI